MQAVRNGRSGDAPSVLKNRDLSRALFGALKEKIGEAVREGDSDSAVVREDSPSYGGRPVGDPVEDVLVSAACEMEDIIRKHAVVRWRESADAQNRMRNDLDDFLFALKESKGIALSLTQMDAIIEAVISTARNRTNDV